MSAVELSSLPLPALFARDPSPPVELAALALARDFEPSLDVAHWMAELDALAGPARGRVRNASGAAAQAAALGTYLFDELGFRGNEESYYDPRNSYLHEVIRGRRGIPITLAVVLVAVARRAGVEAEGVGFPGHFLVRVGGAEGPLVDPFFRGRVVTAGVLDELATRALGGPGRHRPEHLAPADARAVVVRMLHNLKAVHEARGDHALALVTCDRLVDLAGAPEHRRDRARHALALGASAAALDDLEAYLAARPDAPDAPSVRALLAQARSARPRAMQ